jgi:hypothetical protein
VAEVCEDEGSAGGGCWVGDYADADFVGGAFETEGYHCCRKWFGERKVRGDEN